MYQAIFSDEQIKFNRLNLDYIKKNDLRLVFQILMSQPEKRTVADINTLAKIFLNVEPIKKIKNFSTIYHICRSMFLAKFRQKSFIYQKQQQSQCLYIILNGKVGLYKRQSDIDDQQDVIFLSQGNCFGSAYNWKQNFLPLTFQETLVAIVPRRQIAKLSISVVQERQDMARIIKRAKLFGEDVSEEAFKSASSFFTLHRLPFGTFLIKQGEIPKALYYLLKGTVKKQIKMGKKDNDKETNQLIVATYSSGDFFPKQNLTQCLTFNIVAQSPCEIISIPKKALKIMGWSPKICESQWKNQDYYKEQINYQKQWRQYRNIIINQKIGSSQIKPKPFKF